MIRLPHFLTLLCGFALLTVPALEAQRGKKRQEEPPTEPVVAEPTIDPSLYQAMEWRMIGPFRGGRSNASTGVRGDRLTYYFGGVGSGVWKTTDAGESWNNVSDATFGTASVGAIEVSESDSNIVYVGMGEHAVRGVMTSHGDGVYRSDDAGNSWRHLGLVDIRQVSALAIHPKDPNTVYVAAQGAPYGPTEERGIYRSTDGGTTWEKVHFVSRNAGASGLSMDPNNPRVLYAAYWDHLRTPWEIRSGGPGSTVWKTTDGGDTWEQLGETEVGGLPATKGKIDISVAANSNRVYALIEADPGGGVYRSDDRGKSWTKTNEEWGLRARAWYYIKIYADPVDPNTVWVTNAGTYKSIDGGKTFNRVRTPHGDNHHIWIDPDDPDRLINSNDGGANVSFNGGQTWSTQENQPTAQFYRVNVDNQVPYHVYGGQQDNSAIGIKSAAPGGIGWADFYSVAGCESAWAAFDPDDPKYIYGGCYMGIIDEWTRSTRRSRGVQAYTIMPAAMEARDMKYRFNWSSPIVASPQDPEVIYHGGNVVLRTSDRGRSWQEVSPDLTRNDPEKQGKGGGPITNEGAGGEIYGAIYTMAASQVQEGVLWTGSDDGLIHVTQDGAATWQNVTPADIGEVMVNSVEASPHDPARAYAAITRYKFNDFTPMAYKTTDFGATWTRIADGSSGSGIPADAWTRVIREDPVRPGLLYMGTELGAFVSFDDGENWQGLSLNMPVAAITDLIVHRRDNDLVASTAGRSFWILDDLSPLQQLDESVATADLHLFSPEAARRGGGGGGFRPPSSRVGKNPPGPATLDFIVAELPKEGKVTLEVLDSAGNLVTSFEGDADKTGQARSNSAPTENAPQGSADETAPDEAGDDKPGSDEEDAQEEDEKKNVLDKAEEAQVTKFKLTAGMNRVPWDLSHRQVLPIPGRFVFGSLAGRTAIPGTYTVRLTSEGEGDDPPLTREATIEVLPDPREDATAADYLAQSQFLDQVDTDLEAINRSVLKLQATRSQLEAFLAAASNHQAADEIDDAGRELIEKLTEVEGLLIQKKTVDGQTVINFTPALDFHYTYLRNSSGSAEGIVTQGDRNRFDDLHAEWLAAKDQLDQALGDDLEVFNQLVRDREVPAIHVP